MKKKDPREALRFPLFILLAAAVGMLFLLWGQSNAAATLYELGFLRYRAAEQLAAVPEWAVTEEEQPGYDASLAEGAAWAEAQSPVSGSFETETAARWFGESARLTLDYRFYDRGAEKTAVLLHGFAASEADVLPWASHWWERGWNVLIPEQRGYRDPSETNVVPTAWGVYEEFDLYDLIRAAGLTEETVIVHGKGTGAAAALFLAANGELADAGLDGVAAESPYATLGGLERRLLKDLFKLGDWFVGRMLRSRIRDQLGFLPDSVDLAAAAANVHIPVLLVCGEQKTLPGAEESRALYEARAGEGRLLVIPGASYRALWCKGREEYGAALEALFP
ncbi:MAG: hypothetical protein IKP17_05715 [Oscillospiraceae bacterium]|nr:hypothetical protein [Oscillospiraceae bacterium]